MNCKKCGANLPDGIPFCGECGAKVEDEFENKTFCGNCGHEMDYDSVFCGNCGHSNVREPLKKQKTTPPSVVKPTEPVPKKKMGVIIGIIAALLVVAIIAVMAVVVMNNSDDSSDENDTRIEMGNRNKADEDDEDKKDNDDKDDDESDDKKSKKKSLKLEVSEEEAVAEEEIEEDPVFEEKETVYPSPSFTDVTETSVLASQYGSDYYGVNVLDGDSSTAWVEGVTGSGIGEVLTVYASEEQKINGIRILNGYCKSQDIYNKNNRVKEIKLKFADGTEITQELTDTYNTYYDINVGGVVSSYFTVEIVDVYSGTHYDDTCISEIQVY